MNVFRARPVTVEALQWDGTNRQDVRDFAVCPTGGPRFIAKETGDGWYAEMWTGSDWAKVRIGDFIVRQPDGTFAPMSADQFLATYEPVVSL